MSRNDPLQAPIVCDLTALTPTERARRVTLAKKVHAAVTDRRELPDGYTFRLDEQKVIVAEMHDWIGLEGKCCPFLRFALIREGGQMWLNLTGGTGVKDFLKVEIG
jgi:hypothetical protein